MSQEINKLGHLSTRPAAVWARRTSLTLLEAGRPAKQVLMMAADALACVIAAWLSFSIRLGYWQLWSRPVLVLIAFGLVSYLIVFNGIGAYRNIFRYHGSRGFLQLARGCAIIAIPSVIIFGLYGITGIPRTISVIFPALFLAFVALVRITARFLLIDLFGPPLPTQRVLIYGSGPAARQLAFALEIEPGYRLLGYVDDDSKLVGTRIENLPIHNSVDLERVIEREHVNIVLLALPQMSRSQRSAIVKRLQSSEVKVQTLPGVREIVDGAVSIKDLREIEVSELLTRDTVAPDPELLTRSIKGKVVLVTGAGGSIGSELCRQILSQAPRQLVLFDMSEAALFTIDDELRRISAEGGLVVEIVPELGTLDNRAATGRLFERYTPEIVFHAAAYKHVPLVELNTVAGVRNNVFSTLHAAEAAQRSDVERFVLVSTDKAVRPTNVMGASKRVCELVLQALADKGGSTIFSMVRFGNVLGSSGSVVPQFERQLARGGPLTVTHRDVTRFFMTIPEAAELVIQAGAMASGGEVYLLDMGEPVRIYDLASAMIVLAGLTVKDDSNPDGDIAIQEIGLRPGEKLYEELLISAQAQRTAHPRIMKADEAFINWGELSVALDDLSLLLDKADAAAVRRALMNLVPGFGAAPGKQAVTGDGPSDCDAGLRVGGGSR